ncbi:cell division protein FtsW [Arthrobacter sp. MYb229]|uniref:FtsW/RodA/SpoVE family cell cycle protein n=1 Tax=unclassified Arthrobacter TaxID=235627 RepID=UPI000CFAB906|nr:MULTISPECIES: putative peptidoglycan glycosyltransferase FtsW [unclassified Arthrobacter]PRA06327.1 cell division protein FtsW [Arthrobacter sp. MYb229]PRB53229.1 cell division protein FtsW [Arthrobacter sp. MYb216]
MASPRGKKAKNGKPKISPISRLIGNIESGSARTASIDYMLVFVTSIALAVFGVLMVQSSASVEAIARGNDGFEVAISQAMFAALGIACMIVMQFFKPESLKRLAWPAAIIAFGLLFLVAFTPLGHEVLGNRNWIRITATVGLQPSEFAKLALAVFAAFMLEKKQGMLHDYKHLFIPVVAPVGGAILLLVLWGKDVGTALILILIIATALFLGGLKVKWLALTGAAGFIVLSVLVFASSNRRARVLAWLNIDCGPDDRICYQSSMGLHAFASGGWFGVGAGQSRLKWSYVPEAQNDFIFSILGEEFGFVGVLFVLSMFALLALAMYRISMRANDLYTKVLMGCISSWIIGQTFINLGTVSGLLPVIGVPLPFISSGGSAMLAVMLAMGFVLCSARAQKVAALATLVEDAKKPKK